MNNNQNLLEATQKQLLYPLPSSCHPYPSVKKLYDDLLTRMVKNIGAARISLILGEETDFEFITESYQTQETTNSETLNQIFIKQNTKITLPLPIIRETYKSRNLVHYDMCCPSEDNKLPFYIPFIPLSHIFCQPIYSQQSISGVLYLEFGKSNRLPKSELEPLLSLWAEQTSHTVENATQIKLLDEQNRTKTQALVRAKKRENSVSFKRMQILSEMNSELRIPLNTIVGYGQLLQKKGDRLNLPKSFSKYLDNICSSGYQLAELMDNILDYAGFDTGKKSILKEEVDLRLFIRSLYHSAKTDAEQKAVKISYQYEDDLPDHFISDRSALYQAMQTLLKLAVKNSIAGSSVTLIAELEKDYLLFKIQNISNLKPLSSDFPNDNSSSKDNHQSLDKSEEPIFNLVVARKIISILKGELEDRINNKGHCVYTVKIPLMQSKFGITESSLPGKSPVFTLEDRVLVLGDSPFLIQTLSSMLNDLGATPIDCAKETDIPEALSTQQVTVIIAELDSSETEKKVEKAIQHLKKHKNINHPSIIGITKSQQDHLPNLWKKWNIQEVLQTPLNFKKMTSALENFLTSNRSQKPVTDGGQGYKTVDNNRTNPPQIPEKMGAELIADFKDLRMIPIYKGNTLITKLRKMMSKYQEYQPQLTPILKKMELALFDGNNELFNELIRKAQNAT